MNDSYIQVSATIARERANLKLHYIQHLRDREWERRIHQIQFDRNQLQKWFPWLKGISESEAKLKILRTAVNGGPLSPDAIHHGQYNRCKRVLKMADFALDTDNGSPAMLNLSSEDFEHISCN